MISMPWQIGLPRSIDSEEAIVKSIINPRRIFMEIAIIPGLFVGIFALGAAMILWFPYDK